MSNRIEGALRELDYRGGDGVEVRLLWRPEDDALVVSVADLSRGGGFDVPVSAGEARDVFEHPFAYAAHRGIELGAPVRDDDEREPQPALG